jgi:Ulp1 family protease
MNDPKNAQFASKALAKIFPDDDSWPVKMVKVQQQTGESDCGIFVAAFIELLSKEKCPSQYLFDQPTIRNEFQEFLTNEYNFNNFTAHHVPTETEFTNITCNWGFLYAEKFTQLLQKNELNKIIAKDGSTYTVL